MEKFVLKRYLNKRLHQFASFNSSKRMERSDQVAIDELIEKIEPNDESSVSDLEGAKRLLASSEHHTSIRLRQEEIKKKSQKRLLKRNILIGSFILAFVCIALLIY